MSGSRKSSILIRFSVQEKRFLFSLYGWFTCSGIAPTAPLHLYRWAFPYPKRNSGIR